MMLHGGALGDLEVRAKGDGSRVIAGRFPYGATATLSDGGRKGRPKKERFAPGAFSYRVNDPEADIMLLAGHRFDKPLASRKAGTLTLEDTPSALTFIATITAAIAATMHGRDALTLLDEGLATGLSPGFRLPPERAVPRDQAERIEDEGHNPEAGEHNALIRTILAALLFELSIVTKPAYDEAQVEARSWEAPPRLVRPALSRHGAFRWR